MPNSVILGLGLLTITPIFFAFQADSQILAVLAIVTSLAATLWLLRQYARVPWLGWQFLGALVVSGVTLMVTRNWYFTVIAICWLWVGLMTFWIFSSWMAFSDIQRKGIWIVLMTQGVLAVSGLWTFFRYGERATGWMTNANGLGGVLLWGVFLSLVAILIGYRRKWTLPIGVIVLVGWLLTISLTAFVAAVIPGVIFLWWYRRRIPWKPVMIIVIALFAVVVTMWLTGRPKKFVQLMTSQHVSFSFTQRWEFDRVALKMWQQKPWTGWGLGAYRQTFPRFTNQYDEQPLYAHNVYLQVLAETGIVGGLGWLALVVWLGWLGWKLAIRSDDSTEVHLYRALYLGWLAFSLHAAVDFSWHFPAGLVWWLFVSAVIIYRSRQTELTLRPKWQPAIVAQVAIALLVVGVAVFHAEQLSQQAQRAVDTNREEDAISLYREAIKYRGSMTDIQNLAQVYWVRRAGNDLADGQTMLTKALQRNPDNYFLHNALGHNLVAQQKLSAAIDEYKVALQLDPWFHPQFASDLITTLVNEDRKQEATTLLQAELSRYDDGTGNPIILRDFPRLQQLKAELLPG